MMRSPTRRNSSAVHSLTATQADTGLSIMPEKRLLMLPAILSFCPRAVSDDFVLLRKQRILFLSFLFITRILQQAWQRGLKNISERDDAGAILTRKHITNMLR